MSLHQNRVALVTGAARGLGQAIAWRLAADGATLVLADRLDCADTIRTAGGMPPVVVSADVSKQEDWLRIAQAAAPLGGIDIVVNNAAIYPFATIDELDAALWHAVIANNLDSAYYAVKQFATGMRAKCWGRFINIASNIIGTASPSMAHYMASKMGSIGFIRGIANELGQDGITANAVLPSLTPTPGTADVPEETFDMISQLQAIKRRAQPNDITGLVSFLASDDASFITGQTISADGGLYKVS